MKDVFWIKSDWSFTTAYPVSVSGMITVPAMYQAVVANISQIQAQNDASVQVHQHAWRSRRPGLKKKANPETNS